MKKIASRSRRVPPLVAAVVQPVARRLARMEALLLEMRHEQDVQLKRVGGIQVQLDTLTDRVTTNRTSIRRLRRRKKPALVK